MFAIALLLAATLDREVLIPTIELVAPKGFHIESNRGPDFRTYHLVPDSASKSEDVGIGIYAGFAPTTFLHRMYKQPPVVKKPASIAGKPATWSCWKDASGPMCETVLQGLVKGNSMMLHIWLIAHSDGELAKYRRLASSQI